jgi:opacity protein-like surface antigen
MVRKAFVAVAAASLLASGASAQDGVDPRVRAALEKHRESIAASASLLYWIGACEPFINSDRTSFYLEEYALAGSGKFDDFINTFLGRMHLRSYIDGRRARVKTPMTQGECDKLVTQAAAELKAAQDRVKE